MMMMSIVVTEGLPVTVEIAAMQRQAKFVECWLVAA